jgi:hypothetical protein
MTGRGTWERDLAGYVDQHGNIAVDVAIRWPGHVAMGVSRETGVSAPPATVARFLRELADDVDRAGREAGGMDMISADDPDEISEEEFEAAKADVLRRWGAIPPSLQRVIDRGGRFSRATTGAAGGKT